MHEYQIKAKKFIRAHLRCALFLDMGLGKTLITLKALEEMGAYNTLIIAPLTVAKHTWCSEIEKWGIKLTLTKVLGTQKQRKAALEVDANLYITNRENVVWLYENGYTDWKCIIVDELSSFKAPTSKRFKALKKFTCRRFIGLTGTPVSNGLMDLWSQIYLIDQGQRLGKYITNYRQTYFRPGAGRGHVVYEWIPHKDAENRIYSATQDIVLRMQKDKDKLPDIVNKIDYLYLSKSVMDKYKSFEKEYILECENGTAVAGGPAALLNKLLQLSSGAVYGEKEKIKIHDDKISYLMEILESLNGATTIIFYNYIFENYIVLLLFQKIYYEYLYYLYFLYFLDSNMNYYHKKIHYQN
jgi:SNF2 family DNA or RNA helicase